jgi:hypothetical protein
VRQLDATTARIRDRVAASQQAATAITDRAAALKVQTRGLIGFQKSLRCTEYLGFCQATLAHQPPYSPYRRTVDGLSFPLPRWLGCFVFLNFQL